MRVPKKKRAAQQRAQAQRDAEVARSLFSDDIRHRLSEDGPGWAVIALSSGSTYLPPRLTSSVKTRLVAEARKKTLDVVFQYVSGKFTVPDQFSSVSHPTPPGDNDEMRLTKCVSKNATSRTSALLDRVRRICEAAFPLLCAGDPVFLVSVAGNAHQGCHTDAPAGRTLATDDQFIADLCESHHSHIDRGAIPLSVLVPLEAGTHLIVWEGSHRLVWSSDDDPSLPDSVDGMRVGVPLHSFAIFRQDLVHAGDGYLVDHLRGHFFLDPRSGPDHRTRESNGGTKTHFMDETYFLAPPPLI